SYVSYGDASDFAVGAVLGQRIEKHFDPSTTPGKKLLTSSKLVIVDPSEAIMVLATHQRKSLIQVSTGLPFIKMLLSS
nr:hypothetical protein [Tanacetum cinerariifolium]